MTKTLLALETRGPAFTPRESFDAGSSAAWWGSRVKAYLIAMVSTDSPDEADFYAARAAECAVYAATCARLALS